MKLVNIPNYLDENIINYINRIIERLSSSDFEENSFLNWLYENDVESKNNPSAYIKKCFKEQLDLGTFKPKPKINYIPNTQVLANEMRDRGVVILADDSVWLSVVWEYLVNFKGVDLVELQDLNHKILNFMKTNEFSEYKELLVNSNTLKKYDINWKLIELNVDMKIKDWNSLLDEWKSEE